MGTHIRLFHKIAPFYDLFFPCQKRYYSRLFNKFHDYLDLRPGMKILDIGCGTGALAQSLFILGCDVTGVDGAAGMVDMANKRDRNKGVSFIVADARNLPFSDRSFDLVISSYVLHGLYSEDRKMMLREGKRVCNFGVLIHDYTIGSVSFLRNAVEWMEGGGYSTYMMQGKEEMEHILPEIEEIKINQRTSWYFWRRREA